MTGPWKDIHEAELHAYVDNQLDEERRAAVELFLQSNPEAAERVEAYRAQNERLRQLFSDVEKAPIPARLSEVLGTPSRRRYDLPDVRPWITRSAVAALLLFLGGVVGWLLHDRLQPGEGVGANSRQGLAAHAVLMPEFAYPGEVASPQMFSERLTTRLGMPVRLPNLTKWGFSLVSGRLLADAENPAAQIIYEDPAERRISLYVRARQVRAEGPNFRFTEDFGLSALAWDKENLSFALIGGLQQSELLGIARAVYRASDQAN